MVLSDFWNPSDDSGCEATIVVMDEVVRQSDEFFKGFLDRVRNGTIGATTDCPFVLSRCIANLDAAERAKFRDALEIWPT